MPNWTEIREAAGIPESFSPASMLDEYTWNWCMDPVVTLDEVCCGVRYHRKQWMKMKTPVDLRMGRTMATYLWRVCHPANASELF